MSLLWTEYESEFQDVVDAACTGLSLQQTGACRPLSEPLNAMPHPVRMAFCIAAEPKFCYNNSILPLKGWCFSCSRS